MSQESIHCEQNLEKHAAAHFFHCWKNQKSPSGANQGRLCKGPLALSDTQTFWLPLQTEAQSCFLVWLNNIKVLQTKYRKNWNCHSQQLPILYDKT